MPLGPDAISTPAGYMILLESGSAYTVSEHAFIVFRPDPALRGAFLYAPIIVGDDLETTSLVKSELRIIIEHARKEWGADAQLAVLIVAPKDKTAPILNLLGDMNVSSKNIRTHWTSPQKSFLIEFNEARVETKLTFPDWEMLRGLR